MGKMGFSQSVRLHVQFIIRESETKFQIRFHIFGRKIESVLFSKSNTQTSWVVTVQMTTCSKI